MDVEAEKICRESFVIRGKQGIIAVPGGRSGRGSGPERLDFSCPMPQRAYPVLTDNTPGLLPVCGTVFYKEKLYGFCLTVYFLDTVSKSVSDKS